MIIQKSNTIGEIVANNYKTADIFKNHGIDFCCKGGRTLWDVCENKNIDFLDISKELQDVEANDSESINFSSWNLNVLIEYIVEHHHTYVRKNIPLICEYAEKVARVHGANHPETIEINKLLQLISDELIMHMYKEENILFPLINDIQSRSENPNHMSQVPPTAVRGPIDVMEKEHDIAGDILNRISEYSHGYTPPMEACTTYKVLYAKLKDFEHDLNKHIHLENNILFPQAMELAKTL